MSSPQADLLDRVRSTVAGDVREVRMFGAVALMLDDEMLVAVQKDGGLLVRVDPAESDSLREEPYASQAVMGKDRSMGAGWIRVDPTGLSSEPDLRRWLDAALRRRGVGQASSSSGPGRPRR